jgi:hypothetical protein
MKDLKDFIENTQRLRMDRVAQRKKDVECLIEI